MIPDPPEYFPGTDEARHRVRDLFPLVVAPRAALTFDLSPEGRRRAAIRAAADRALQGAIARRVDALMRRHDKVVEAACVEALFLGADVHVHYPPSSWCGEPLGDEDPLRPYPYLGIELTPSAGIMPTVHHYHRSP